MTKDEALKMALEVLEQYDDPDLDMHFKAVTALRQAIEQAEKQDGFLELAGTPSEKETGSASANTDPVQQAGVTTSDYSLYDEDLEALYNLRGWLEQCLIDGRAEITGTGIGLGGVDLTFDLDGFPFYIECKPRFRSK